MAGNRFANSNLFGAMTSNDKQAIASHVTVKDIDIELIDFDKMNEELNGYDENELDTLETAMESTKKQEIVGVYQIPDSNRYLCYSGHRRILIAKKKNKKQITAEVHELPDRNTQIETLILMNTQRDNNRPLFIARKAQELIRIARERNENSPVKNVAQKLGMSTMQLSRYMKILELPDVYQELCKRKDFPFTVFDKEFFELNEEERRKVYEQIEKIIEKEGSISYAQIQTFIRNINRPSNNKELESPLRNSGRIYKSVDNMVNTLRNTLELNESVNKIKNAEVVKQQAQEAINLLNQIILKCNEQ